MVTSTHGAAMLGGLFYITFYERSILIIIAHGREVPVGVARDLLRIINILVFHMYHSPGVICIEYFLFNWFSAQYVWLSSVEGLMSTSCLLLSAVLPSHWGAQDANTSVCRRSDMVQASILDVPIMYV